jgi:hypothetical protein
MGEEYRLQDYRQMDEQSVTSEDLPSTEYQDQSFDPPPTRPRTQPQQAQQPESQVQAQPQPQSQPQPQAPQPANDARVLNGPSSQPEPAAEVQETLEEKKEEVRQK